MSSLEVMCFTMAILFPIMIIIFNGIHTIDEGHVGVYYRGGALLDEISEPGYNLKLPLITTYENV
jgi:regulator of protease activity HflC (stomatin/prohibitin superfamily)